jgi:hypothetical protein
LCKFFGGFAAFEVGVVQEGLLLPATCYLLLAACYLLLATCYLLLVGETRWMEMKETGKGNRGDAILSRRDWLWP